MPRTTRAAAKALEDDRQPEESALSSSESRDNIPNAKFHNATENSSTANDIEPALKKSKGKKKGAKAKKAKATKVQDEEDEVTNGVESGVENTPTDSHESKAVDNGLKNGEIEGGGLQGTHDKKHDQVIERPSSSNVKVEHVANMSAANNSVEPLSEETNQAVPHQSNGIHSKLSHEVSGDNLAESRYGDLNNDTATESAKGPKMSSQSTSLLTSPTITVPVNGDPIEAIDALEDALEEVGKILPTMEPNLPEKPVKKPAPVKGNPVKRTPMASTPKPGSNVVKSSAVAGNTKSFSLAKSTQPSALSRSTSTRATPIVKSTTNPRVSTAAKRQSMVILSKESNSSTTPASTTTDYLASKRRPISMQFPPPPPKPKSSKTPTRPTFTLPGDAILAKRKAMMEEKLKKEQEELAKKREFKARPVPGSGKARPASMIVRQTASSIARTSLLGNIDSSTPGRTERGNASTFSTTLKRSGTVTGATTSTPSKDKPAPKRSSVLYTKPAAPVPANSSQKRQNSAAPKPDVAKRASIILPKRPITLNTTRLSTTSRSASGTRSMASSTMSSSPGMVKTVTAEEAVALKRKGRQIYNRDRLEKEERERERREKEEAAKTARAQAAEKGRQASREWAEKQRRRVQEAKQQQQRLQGQEVTVPQ